MSLASDLRKIAARRNNDLDKIARSAVNLLSIRVIADSPVGKGIFINNWMSATGNVNTTTTDDADLSGSASYARLTATIDGLQAGETFYFSNSLPYARRLEYDGWSAKAPSGMVVKNLPAWRGIVESEVEKYK